MNIKVVMEINSVVNSRKKVYDNKEKKVKDYCILED